jgi:tetratricopeptide (TPR) repeat protein
MEAVPHLQEAVRLKPGHVDSHIQLGKAYEQLKQPEAAEREFRAAIALKADAVEAVYGLARVLKKTGRTAEAKSYYEKYDKLQQRSKEKDLVATLNARGIEFKRQGRLDEAVASYNKALALDPSSPDVAYNLGLVLVSQGKTAEGIKAFRRAVGLRPSFVLAQTALATALEKLGDPSAKEERRKADLLKSFVPPVADRLASD